MQVRHQQLGLAVMVQELSYTSIVDERVRTFIPESY